MGKMHCMGAIVTGLLVGQLALGSRAMAADQPPITLAMRQPAQPATPPAQPAQPAQPQPGQGQPAQPAPGYPPAPPPPAQSWGTPPPGYPGAQPGYGPPPPYSTYYQPQGPNPMAYMTYEAQKKNVGISILLEFLLPGLGSIYSDHAAGALITWTCLIVGIVLMVRGASELGSSYNDRTGQFEDDGDDNAGIYMGAGLLLLLGGRIYGFVDSYQSPSAYNRALAARLGLPAGFSMGVGPIGGGQMMTVGPRVGFTF
jgi:hypothetical protein